MIIKNINISCMQRIVIVTAYTDGVRGTASVDITWLRSIVSRYENVDLIAYNLNTDTLVDDQGNLTVLDCDYTPLLRYISESTGRPVLRNDWARIGFFAFKPKILRMLCSRLQEDTTLIWIDGNASKYTSYPRLIERLIGNSRKLLDKHDLLVFHESILSTFRIQCELSRFGIAGVHRLADYPIVWAGCFAVRINKTSFYLLDEWESMCLRKRLLVPMQICPDPPADGFMYHSQEQALLSIYLYRIIRGSPIRQKVDKSEPRVRVLLLPGARMYPLRPSDSKRIVSTVFNLSVARIGFVHKIHFFWRLIDAITSSFSIH